MVLFLRKLLRPPYIPHKHFFSSFHVFHLISLYSYPKFNSKRHNALPSTMYNVYEYPSVSQYLSHAPHFCVIWRTTNEILYLIQLISIIFILCMGLLNYYLRTTENCLFCFFGMYIWLVMVIL